MPIDLTERRAVGNERSSKQPVGLGVAESLYPPNILIGTVSRVLDEDSAIEKLLTVRPAVDFSSLSLVLVVLSRDVRG